MLLALSHPHTDRSDALSTMADTQCPLLIQIILLPQVVTTYVNAVYPSVR